MKPNAKTIIREARRLRDEKYALRFADIEERHQLRFRKKIPLVPEAYNDTAVKYMSPEIEEQGRQALALIYALPVPHVPPPMPEDQQLTTKNEVFLSAALQELESHYGSVWMKNSSAQVHDNFSWIYLGMKRKPYAKAPKTPDDDADEIDKALWNVRNERYKKEAGIASVFDYGHRQTSTVMCVGDYRNPVEIYNVREVDEHELIATYGLSKEPDGKLRLPDGVTTLPDGEPEYKGKNTSRKLKVIEFWDRNWCMIVVENGAANWRGSLQTAESLVLDEWEHNWGRVPYFGCPAFENEVLEEELRYSGPMDGLHAELGEYNDRRTMFSNVATLKSYPSWQMKSAPDSLESLDANGKPIVMTKFVPGQIFHNPPGSEIEPIPMVTGPELFQELLAIEQRITKYSLSDIAKGISPGADTANSAITQLRRLQRSALSPLTKAQADQAREMFKFILARVKGEEGEGIGEETFVYSASAGEMIGLAPDDIVTMNLQVKVAPDTGQDNLIEEKQAAELWQMGLITMDEFNSRRGKENPEVWSAAIEAEQFKNILRPQMQQQILASFGNVEAMNQIATERAAGGDAREAVPNIMAQLEELQTGGMGSGSPDMPRAMGVRSPAIAQTTQPEGGVA